MIETLVPATRDRIQLVLDGDETLREWVREAVETADLGIVSGDLVDTIQAAVWHCFWTEVDPDLNCRAETRVDLPAETWAHIRTRVLARSQLREDNEGSGPVRHRDSETVLEDILWE